MALPTRANLLTNGYFFRGAAFVDLEAKPLTTIDNGYFFRNQAFLVAGSGTAVVSSAGANFIVFFM